MEACDALAGLADYSETPVDITDNLAAYGVSVDEDCGYSVTYADVADGDCPVVVTRTFTATDECGNTGTAVQVITIGDTTDPVVTLDEDQINLEACDALAGLTDFSETAVDITDNLAAYGVSVDEDCDFTVTYADVADGDCPVVVTRTFTATDECGNTGTAIQVITIDDTTAPVVTLDEDQK
jgi:large repetitive protein